MTARELEKMGSRVIVLEMYCLESAVRGHHICKRVWNPLVGEKLPVDIKKDNANTPRADAVQTCGVVVGHVLKACSLASSIGKGL